MQQVYPNYYPLFRCAAGACRHTCCAGWEIDLDAETVQKYLAVPGRMGARLRDSVSTEGTPHFLLTKEERCPFLNADRLCDLILYGGEDMLCQICRDHPRFRSFLPGRTEIGLGLCCEAAAKLILFQEERTELVILGEKTQSSQEAEALLELRAELMRIAQDSLLTIEAREERILGLFDMELPAFRAAELAEFLLSLERMDEKWTEILNRLQRCGEKPDMSAFSCHMAARQREYEKLLLYFLYRYLPMALQDGDPYGKAAFAVLSARLLYLLGALQFRETRSFTQEDQAELARLYSSEIEYSQENLDRVFDFLC